MLSAALTRLRSELRAVGSDLCVRVGPWGEQLGQLAAAAGGAAAVISEAEVELKWVAAVCRVAWLGIMTGGDAGGGRAPEGGSCRARGRRVRNRVLSLPQPLSQWPRQSALMGTALRTSIHINPLICHSLAL